MEQRRLGRGLSSLLPNEGAQVSAPSKISIDLLVPNRFQPREAIDDDSLQKLSESIKKNGILQPIVIRRTDTNFEIVSGERRWRAAKRAGLLEVPVVVRENVTEGEMLELAILENVQRVDLNAIEKARGYKRLADEFGKTQDEIARGVGQDRATIANTIRLLELPIEIQEAVQANAISSGHARALLSIPDVNRRKQVFERAIREDMSVRDVERVAAQQGARKKTGERRRHSNTPVWVSEIEDRWRRRLGVRIELALQGQRARISIHCATLDELERVTDLAVGLPSNTERKS